MYFALLLSIRKHTDILLINKNLVLLFFMSFLLILFVLFFLVTVVFTKSINSLIIWKLKILYFSTLNLSLIPILLIVRQKIAFTNLIYCLINYRKKGIIFHYVKKNNFFFCIVGALFTSAFVVGYYYTSPATSDLNDLNYRLLLKKNNDLMFSFNEHKNALHFEHLKRVCKIMQSTMHPYFWNDQEIYADKIRYSGKWLVNFNDQKQCILNHSRIIAGNVHPYLYHWSFSNGLAGFGHDTAICGPGTEWMDGWCLNEDLLKKISKSDVSARFVSPTNEAGIVSKLGASNPNFFKTPTLTINKLRIDPGVQSPQTIAYLYSLGHREILSGIQPCNVVSPFVLEILDSINKLTPKA